MDNRLLIPRASVTNTPPAAPTLYFSFRDEYELAWELTNWFQDAACTIPATALPTAADDVVFLTDANNIDAPATFECRNMTATGVILRSFFEAPILAAGVVTLDDVYLIDCNVQAASIVATDSAGAFMDYGTELRATTLHITDYTDGGSTGFFSPDAQFFGSLPIGYVEGNATFNDTVEMNYEVRGNATFNDSSKGSIVSNYLGTAWQHGVYGNATFNDSSENLCRVGGNATFNGNSVNAFVDFEPPNNFAGVQGNATFNDASNNFGVVEGTITCNTTGVCVPQYYAAPPYAMQQAGERRRSWWGWFKAARDYLFPRD
jgi:hypothetical protein